MEQLKRLLNSNNTTRPTGCVCLMFNDMEDKNNFFTTCIVDGGKLKSYIANLTRKHRHVNSYIVKSVQIIV